MWIIPTRSRPEKVKSVLEDWVRLECSEPLAIVVDSNDPRVQEYFDLKLPQNVFLLMNYQGGTGAGNTFEVVLKTFPQEPYYALLSDDAGLETKGFDKILPKKAGPFGMSFPHDGKTCDFGLYPCIGGELVRAVGYIKHPTLNHLGIDNFWTHLARALGRLIPVPSVTIRHNDVSADEKFGWHDDDRRNWEHLRYGPGWQPLVDMVSSKIVCPKLNIVCVKWGDKYSADYVNILFDMVIRNMTPREAKFICFTDDHTDLDPRIETRPLPGNLDGWWNKIYLFKEGVFENGERVVFFDLDTLVINAIDRVLFYGGEFAILRDFYRPNGLQSSVMLWEAGKLNHFWTEFEKQEFPNIEGGDQAFIESLNPEVDILQVLFPGKFASYKVNCINGPSPDNSVIVFHGEPKPDNCDSEWVNRIWKIGGDAITDVATYCNVPDSELNANIIHSCLVGKRFLTEEPIHDKTALIVGGGPSLINDIGMVRARQKSGQIVFALNGSAKLLADHGIEAEFQVILDAKESNFSFISESVHTYLLASQVNPKLIDALKDFAVIWHASIPGMRDLFPKERKNDILICGGTTVLTRCMTLVHAMGYRRMHLFGVDSSFSGDEHHAYKQDQNDKPSRVTVNGKDFMSCPWMIAQVNEFQTMASFLADDGSKISVNGDGLLPFVARCMMAA